MEGNTLLPERIASTLRNAIVGSVLAPGARLEEQGLAKRLGVSRVPLREAFRVLAGEGLVVIQPNRGAVVRRFDSDEIRDRYSVRAQLEGYAGELACNRDAAGVARLGPQSVATLTLPAVDPAVAPILYTIPVQLLAYYTAVAKGTDVDQPRNLAKSVTVE